ALADQLRARGDAELGENLTEVILDRPRAEEQLRGDLLVRLAPRYQTADLELLRRQLGERAHVAAPGRLAGGAKLAVRALLPRPGAEPLEDVGRGAQVLPRLRPPPVAAQELAIQQLGASAVELGVRLGVLLKRRGEQALRLRAVGDEPAAAGEVPLRPRRRA